MAKRKPIKRYHRASVPQKVVPIPTTNEPLIYPNETTGPEGNIKVTIANLYQPDTTSAPSEGEEGEEGYSKNQYQLLERLISDKLHLSFRTVSIVAVLLWFGFLSWLFIQDNGASKIDNLEQLNWFGTKILAYTGLLIVALILIAVVCLISWLGSRGKTNKMVAKNQGN